MAMLDRFLSKTIPEPNSGCLLWTAHVSKDGYGRFGIGRIAHEAHRVAYKLFKGEIPQGLCVDHICKVRSCVNPNHLRLLTREDNSRFQDNFNARKKHCKCGNEYTLINDRRICKLCQAKASKKFREKSA
jgi:hypothetical protein